ncbi:MAG: type II toxin-antitoxin system HicB family antitoxin [Lachnospiraceae bacterium]|nr:type II toxin-antitoxin system HicB family antitoxin [Lachnospiraceae bacterium]
MLSIYPACFYKEADGQYSVIFPDLDNLSTCGSNLGEAMAMAIDCLAGYLKWCSEDGTPVPEPSPLSTIDPIAIAKEIDPDDTSCEAFVNMVSVDVEAYAKEHFDKSVKKTLTIPSWLNTAALEAGINFSQTLKEALMAKLKIQSN